MAASGASGGSSSSEDEALAKCKEAVWNIKGDKTAGEGSNGKQSRRLVVSDHDHDGNELKVTPQFQAHVAKKLEQFLDSWFSETPAEVSSRAESTKSADDDDGFRLFTTSVPGQRVNDVPPPVRRRPVSSSSDSDSDMDMRLREAAVSLSDLLPPSSLPATLSAPLAEAHCSEKMKEKKEKEQEKEEATLAAKKKKKKKKPHQEESEGLERKLEHRRDEVSEEESLVPKKKKKKKKDLNQTENE